MHVESGSAAPPGGRGARWPGDWLAARRRPGSFNIRAETRPAWRRPWWRLWCAIGQQIMATKQQSLQRSLAARPASPANLSATRLPRPPSFAHQLDQGQLEARQSRGQRQPNVCPPASRIVGSAHEPSSPFGVDGRKGGGKRGRAPSSPGKCAFRRRSMPGMERSPGRAEAAAAGGRLSPRRRPWELGPQPAV